MDNAVVKDIDVFVSYSHKDKAVADGMVATLESHKLRCWYAPRDVIPGQDWASAIMAAIRQAKFFVLVFSDNSNQSGQVLNEVTNAFNSGCVIIPFKIDQAEMRDNLSYYLASVHWLDAVQPPMTDRYEELVEQIFNTMGREVPEDLQNRLSDRRQKKAQKDAKNKNPGKKIPAAAIAGIAVAVIAVIAAAAFVVLGRGSSESEEEPEIAAAEETEEEIAAETDWEEETAEEIEEEEEEPAEEEEETAEEEEELVEEIEEEELVETDADLVDEDGYILSAAAIPDEGFEKMLEELEDEFYSYVASKWNTDYTTVVGFDCTGYYFLTEKDSASPHNLLYLVCQVNVEYFAETSAGFTDSMITYYYYGGYENLMLLEDGTFSVDYTDLSTPSVTFTELDLIFKGYQDPDSMFSELVTSRIDKYVYEDTVEDRDFGYELTQLDSVRAIPDDAKEYNGHYYKLYEVSDMTWTKAVEQCELRGGHLATVTSEEEENFLTIQIVSGSRCYWLGGYYDVSKEWRWVTGEDMDFTDWLSDDDGTSRPYLALCEGGWMYNSEEGGNWGGIAVSGAGYNSTVIGYICEWDSDVLDEEETAEASDETADAEGEEEETETARTYAE